MKVVLFWLFHWWREVLSPPKQLLKLDTVFNAVVSYCGVILFVVFANFSLLSVANAEVKYPRMSTDVKHVGVHVHGYNSKDEPIVIVNGEKTTENENIRNISRQIKKTVFGSEDAPSFVESNCGKKVAQLSAQIDISAKKYADDPEGTQVKLNKWVTALWNEGLAVHLLLSLHDDIYDKDQAKFGGKTSQGYFQSKVKKTEGDFTYGKYVPYKPCLNNDSQDCPYDKIFENFHVPVINYLRDKKLLSKIAVIYVYNEFDYGENSTIESTDKQALTETLSRTFDIAYTAANKEVPIGVKFSTIKDNKNSAWKNRGYIDLFAGKYTYTYDSLERLLKKDIVLGYDCYTKSEQLNGQCEEDKVIFLNTISDSDKTKYQNGRIEIAEYGRKAISETNPTIPRERTELFMTNLVKSWSNSSGFSFFGFNADDHNGITYPPEKTETGYTYTFKKYDYVVDGIKLKFDGERELSHLKKQMDVLAPTVKVFPDFSQRTIGQGQISFDTNVSLDSCPNFRGDWKVFVDNKPIDNAIWLQHRPNDPPQGSIDPRRYTFNLYTAMGISSDNFLQPVKLDISVNGQEIYAGCFPFKDVCARRWYAKPVIKLWKQGVIKGNSPTTFGAYSVATRAEFVTAVVRIVTKDSNPYLILDKSFNDIEPSGELWQAVELAKSKGWISGCGDSKFCPNDPISNAEAMKILALAFKRVNDKLAVCQSGKIVAFKDVNPTSWYAPYACAARQAYITDGFAGYQLRPEQSMTRASMAKAICVAAYGVNECIESGDENLPMVLAVTPRKATVGQSITLNVEGFHLPTVTMTLFGCDKLSPLTGGTEDKQQFTCTPSKAGNLSGQVKDATGTVLHEFLLNVATAATQGTPVPDTTTPVTPTNPPDTTTPTTEPGGAADNPGDATKLFILDGQMTSTCTFVDVDQDSVFAEAVRALCSAGILVGYWENGERVFVKLDPNNPTAARNLPGNKNLQATLGEVLKVFMFSVDYDYFSARHDPTSKTWYTLFTDEAVARGLNLNGLVYSDNVTREQAMTWLAQLFYRYTGSDPIGFLVGKKLTDGSRPTEAINRYELALFTYRAILDTGRTNTIPFGLWGEPASLPQPLGTEISAKALANVGERYPYSDGKYTYCARFVRMMFDKQAIWGDAKSMCNHYGSMIQTSQTPPAGAVICYAPNASNYNYGHVAIAVGDGTEVGATSLTNGVTKRNSVYGSAYQGWIDATTFSNNYPQ